MAKSIVLTKRPSGGFTFAIDGGTPEYVSKLEYITLGGFIKIMGPVGVLNQYNYSPSEWTIDGVTGFATNVAVADALEALGLGNFIGVLDTDSLISAKVIKLTGSLTRPANTSDYAAGDAVNTYTANVKQKETVTVSGTNGTLNLSIPNIANRTVAFTTDAAGTAAKFVTDYAADFLPLVVVTANGADIVFEAATAGVPFDAPVVVGTGDMAGAVVHTTANVKLIPISFLGAARANGGGGYLNEIKIETDAVQFAGCTLKLWLFNDIPTGIVGDNVAYVNNFANASKRMCDVEVILGALLAGSDCVFGKSQPFYTYVCDTDDTTIYMLVQVLNAVVAPKSAGSFNFCLNTVQV